MAKIEGGLHGKPKGSVANITYSEARGRNGKITTARQKVDPANPQTSAQQDQRNKFTEAQNLVQRIGADIYQGDFNRAVSDLPGFQSLQKIFLDNIDASGVVSVPADINLGSLDHLPNLSMTLATSSPHISLSYDSGTGDLGTTSDVIVASAFKASLEGDGTRGYVESVGTKTRSDSPITLDMSEITSGDTVISMVYVRGKDSAEGLLSSAVFLSGTA